MSHMKESCHVWMCRVTHMNESCHTWGSLHLAVHEPRLNESCPISHVPYEEGMSHMKKACPIWMRYVTSHVRESVPIEEGMSHMNVSCCIWMRYVTSQVKKACPIWRRHVPYESVVSLMIVSCLYEWVMSRMNVSCSVGIRHVTCEGVSTLWHTSHRCVYMCIYCHTWMSHVTCEWVMSHVNESCHTWMIHITYAWVLSNTQMMHVAHTWVKSSMNVHVHTWKNASPDSFMGRVTYERIMCIELCL